VSETKSTHAAAAALIRAGLKRNGLKARVTSQSYSGGNSIRVRIQQDVLPETRKQVEQFCGRFQAGHFDGMTDCYEFSNARSDVPQVRFVFVEVDYSAETKAAAASYVANINGLAQHELDRYAYMALIGSWGSFWQQRKPRRRYEHSHAVAQQVAA
jgi:hypothetical protein